MIVRPARPSDADAIVAIVNPIIAGSTITFASTPRDRTAMKSMIAARRGAFFVAERGGAVSGYVTCAPFRGGTGYARTMEHTIVLGDGARGQGLGRALMSRLEGSMQGEGIHSLVAAISGENVDAVAFHAAIGFAEVGRIPQAGWKFSRWIDLVLMQKMLVASA